VNQPAAVVVNFNAAPHLAPCVASLRDNGVHRVVVVDNGSTDGSRHVLSGAGVHWVDAGANLGYGAAANVGAAWLAGADLLICNPDVVARPGTVAALRQRMAAEEDLAVVGPRLENPDGSLYPSARAFPDMVDAVGHGLLGLLAPANRFTRRYRMLDWDHARAARVDWVSGAFMLVRRSAWDDLGGFDPAYFMYMEDVDLCWRAHRCGYGVAYEPAAVVTHVQGASSRQHPYRMLAAHHRSMWRFARRFTTGGRRAVLPVIGAGLAARWAVTSAHHLAGAMRNESARPLP
jgi:N-acetylglucosaminyl-diphospho-decaprenol L-rhamnosyltransferase